MKKAIQPSHMIVVGVCAMLSAGFFAVAHVGSAKREIRGMEYGFGSRKAPEPPPDPGLVASFKRGAEAIADKAGDAVDDFFSWGDSKPAGTVTASADQAGAEGAGEEDPFEDFYKRNYGKGSGSSAASYGDSSSGGSFGGGSFGGGSWGGSSATSGAGAGAAGDDGLPAAGSGAKAPAAKGSDSSEDAESGRAPRASRPLVENEEGEWVKRQFRNRRGAGGDKLASLPGGGPLGGLERAGDLSGGRLEGAGGSSSGKLEGMAGQKGKVDLNGPDEKAASGAQSSYDSKMSGGASAAAAAGAAAAGGGGVPAASGPKEVGAGEGGEKGKDGKDGKGGDEKAKDGKSSSDNLNGPSIWTLFKKKPASASSGVVTASAKTKAAEEEPDFLKEVAAARQRGGIELSEADAQRQPDEAQLKSGALIRAPRQKAASLAEDGAKKAAEPEEKPDPEKFSKLSDERKKELRNELLVFLKSIENKHGAMTQILYTPCSKDKETCSENGLTMGFITMHTDDGARVQVSLKYAEKRWTPCTVSFGVTVDMQKLSPRQPPAEDQDDGDPDGDEETEAVES